MKNTSLDLVVARALPALSGESVTYNAAKNVFLTQGYTSSANNFYFKAYRFSKRLAIEYDLAKGYAREFLNGIVLYCWDGTKAKIIANKTWGGCLNYRFFSEEDAKQQSILMLKEFLEGQAKMLGRDIDEQQLLSFSREMVEETQRKTLSY